MIAVGRWLVLSFTWNKIKVKDPSTNYTLKQAVRPKPDAAGPAAPPEPDPTDAETDAENPPQTGA